MSIRSIVLAVVLLGALAPAVRAQGDAKKGEALFTEQKCNLCHAIGGKGNAKGPLDSVGAKLKPEEIRLWLVDTKAMTAKSKSERKPEMKVYTLEKDDVDSLVAYLSTLKKK